jgi:hypothetical protein
MKNTERGVFTKINSKFIIMKNTIYLILAICTTYFHAAKAQETMNLSGEWRIILDSLDKGEKENWAKNAAAFTHKITLPSTTDLAKLGNPNTLQPFLGDPVIRRLTRKFSYVGAAWYQKEVTIPASWNKKSIFLQLERVIWKTQVWIDGQKVEGVQNSLVTPHHFDLSKNLTVGKHTITICVDNRKQFDVSLDVRNFAHAYTEETQSIWNGILGKIQLSAKNAVYTEGVQVRSENGKNVGLSLIFRNNTGKTVKKQVKFAFNNKEIVTRSVEIQSGNPTVNIDFDLKNPLSQWDEFNPKTHEVSISTPNANGADVFKQRFGVRQLTNKNALLQINNRRLFLRGTLECAIFPQNGHPPMTKEGWYKVFKTAKSYGLNHLRFHSYCPPDAAFEAADELGFYLQVELPQWILNFGKDAAAVGFLRKEGENILKHYGNHPSFCFLSMGNELEGDYAQLSELMQYLKKMDNRHLYTTTTYTFQKGHGQWSEPHDDFLVTQQTKKGWVRGQGVFNSESPDFSKDFRKSIDSLTVPLITHEIGQYAVFPKLDEIGKYQNTPFDPLNFKAVKDDLSKKGLLEFSQNFTKTGGKIAAILYKEEIERALKTKGISGIQLLDLHDFPGQGTALVGVLDAFWDSKGIIEAADFSRFCAPVVPLMRFPKAVYTNAETFNGAVEIANFSAKTLAQTAVEWSVSENNQVLFKGNLSKTDIAIGSGEPIGNIQFSLEKIIKPTCLTVKIAIPNTDYSNDWQIWVYPNDLPKNENDVVITQNWEEAATALDKGQTVLFNPTPKNVKGVKGAFVPVFWSPVHFPAQSGAMGLLMNPQHKAFAHFPTQAHSDWQWWELCTQATFINIDTAKQITPLVTAMDNFVNNRKLAAVFEAKVGNGKLLMCGMDISTNLDKRLAAKQLRYSLIEYVKSADFNPSVTVEKGLIKGLLMP